MKQQGPLQQLTALFTEHRVAANLLMVLMILAGIWGLKKLNTQFFPTFELDLITISVIWGGAAAEDVEQSIVLPVEEAVRSVSGIDTLYGVSRQGAASFRLELVEGTDAQVILDEVKQKMDGIRSSLPSEAEEPIVQRVTRYEEIASVLLTSSKATLEELRPLAKQLEQELLASGIRKVDFTGLPDEQIAIKISTSELNRLNLSLSDIASLIDQSSVDLPAGTAAKGDGSRQLRSLGQQRTEEGFATLPVIANSQGQLVRLGDIADISWEVKEDQVELAYRGQPAVLLALKRTEQEDTLKAASILSNWLAKTEPTLPEGVELIVYDERWAHLEARINLLLKNGLGGLVLVIAVLFLFLNARVAFWVTVGIPVSFLATLAMLNMLGGSINMISLFALIMALGIIVDDAIVVGEDTLTHVQMGESGRMAAIGGAQRMLSPVIASSLTTIAAFLPLMLIGGIMGNIMIDIPTVIICVILASLVECFLILPGHLHHSLKHRDSVAPSGIRQKLDNAFNHFKDHTFRQLVRLAIEFKGITIAAALSLFILTLGLIVGGQVKFNFFPAVETDAFSANVQFLTGTEPARVQAFLNHLDTTLRATEAELSDTPLLSIALQKLGAADFPRTASSSNSGDEFGTLYVESLPADYRHISNRELIQAWRKKIQLPAGIERFSIDQGTSGPPGKPIEVKLIGSNPADLKEASLQVQTLLKEYAGLSNFGDDLPYGASQLIYHLTPEGATTGLKLEQIGRQLRAAFDGIKVQQFYNHQDEVEVRVMLPDAEREQLAALEHIPILLPNGTSAPLANIVTFTPQQGFDSLQRINGQMAINVSADLDEDQANANEIIADLKAGKLDKIISPYGIRASFEGKNKSQRETLADMQMGLILALALIYIILAWVFASYSWPLTVMLAIPLGLTGAVLGHYFTDQNLTILSLFGLFGLSGIVVNDSIVLVTFYKKLREAGMSLHEAIEEAACQRLRAVLLTSLTTIAGLTPILFETSTQAQFLIPMATSIVFGLAYGTLLILLVVPATLTYMEQIKSWLGLAPSFTVKQQA